jgi:hypothetical protein
LVRFHSAASGIEQSAAEFGGRQAVPRHARRGQMPGRFPRRSRHARCGLIARLVTR